MAQLPLESEALVPSALLQKATNESVNKFNLKLFVQAAALLEARADMPGPSCPGGPSVEGRPVACPGGPSVESRPVDEGSVAVTEPGPQACLLALINKHVKHVQADPPQPHIAAHTAV